MGETFQQSRGGRSLARRLYLKHPKAGGPDGKGSAGASPRVVPGLSGHEPESEPITGSSLCRNG
jgi:hypothetical protein